MKNVLLYVILLLMGVNLYACQEPLTLDRRKEIAQNIMSNENVQSDRLSDIAQKFAQENYYTCTWFEGHKQELSKSLSLVAPDIEVKMMGSRRWNTNHMLSDIDAVVVTSAVDHEKIVDGLQAWYTVQYPNIKQFRTKTKAGLSLFILKNFIDQKLGEMKLEYTVQSPETNTTIIEGMMQRLAEKFKSTEEKTRYALAMMKAVYDNDVSAQLALKEWTRVLPTT